MQRHSYSFSLYAFAIAILVHIVIILLLTFIEKITPILPPPPKDEKASESRFKVSLKEQPKASKEALVKNEIPKVTKARPMPKGEQLKTPTLQQPKQAPKPSSPTAQPTPPAQETTPVVPEPKKAFERHVAKEVATIERKPQPKGLYDILSQADPEAKISSKSSIKINNSVKKLYGDTFGELSEEEQAFLIDNYDRIQNIQQATFTRLTNTRIVNDIRYSDTYNVVEFYFYPDGHISDLHIITQSKFPLFDEITIQTIEYSFSKYPRPQQKTLMRTKASFWQDLH